MNGTRMKHLPIHSLSLALCQLLLLLQTADAAGPLRVHPTSPRYFTDGTKNADGTLRAVYDNQIIGGARPESWDAISDSQTATNH